MIGKIKKLKDNNGEFVYPITVSDSVYVESNKTLTQKLSELATGSTGQVKQWSGGIWNAHGDSVTKLGAGTYGGYPTKVNAEHQFGTVRNLAMSGYTLGAIHDLFIAQPTDANLITLSGGGNFMTNYGDITSLGKTTLYGALNSMVQWYFTNMPTATLLIITTHQADYVRTGTTLTTDGAHRKKQRDAMIEIAEMYSLPVIDLWLDSGFTVETSGVLTTDGKHPNDKGYNRMATLINRKLYDLIKTTN